MLPYKYNSVTGQLPAATTLVMAIERIIAVKCPLYFKIKWTSTSKAQLISIAWLSSIVCPFCLQIKTARKC
jgi:hypothetical protein